MDARTQRTLYRLLAVFLAAGASDAILQYLSDGQYDWRHLIAGLSAAAIIALEQFVKNSGDNAPPTLAAVNVALDNAIPVLPPKVANPEVAILTDPKPPGTT